VEGRIADDAPYWLSQESAAWRDAVQVVAIDMCSIYASAVPWMLPGATARRGLVPRRAACGVGHGDVRWVVRARYGRRGRAGDPEYGVKSMLVRDLRYLSAAWRAQQIPPPACVRYTVQTSRGLSCQAAYCLSVPVRRAEAVISL